MVVLYALCALLVVVLIYILFLTICSLFVNPRKEYEEHSQFYRTLLNGATAIAIKIMR